MYKNIVVAMDSFKGSISSLEAGAAVCSGIRRVISDAEVIVRPIADGGEGTVDALTMGMDGTMHSVVVTGPLGRQVEARYGILADRRTAVMEMAMAAGITLIDSDERNPLYTTTYGVGEMILDAVEAGCRHFIMGIGGSATNDGGIGMLQALGFGMLDENGEPVERGALGLKALRRITMDNVPPVIRECSFHIACDVTNPLCGERGASAVYGPQKGATPEMVRDMDDWMADYAKLAAEALALEDGGLAGSLAGPGGSAGADVSGDPDAQGMGAAGGMGFAFKTFLGAEIKPGIETILEETDLEDKIRSADLVITGEGRLDGQTIMGKVPVGVAGMAKKYGKPVIAFAGVVDWEAGRCNEYGIDAFFPIIRSVVTKEEAKDKENACRNLEDTVEQVMRVMKIN